MTYWVVGAMFGGTEDNLDSFIRRGYWYCWDPQHNQEIPAEVENRFPQIQIGDRIAVKRMLGRGATEVEIRAPDSQKQSASARGSAVALGVKRERKSRMTTSSKILKTSVLIHLDRRRIRILEGKLPSPTSRSNRSRAKTRAPV